MLYIKSGVFHSGDFKNDVYFCVRVPPTLARAPLEGGAGGGMKVLPKKACNISIMGFFIVGISKMMFIFVLGYPQPLQGRPWKGGRGGE